MPGSVPASPYPSGNWLTHSRELDRAWKRVDEQLQRIRAWAPTGLGDFHNDTGPVFYMFSGPDFLYANAFFPEARVYVLCARESVGKIPDLTTISPQSLGPALANLRQSLDSMLSWSFFITKNMKSDLTRPELPGVLPLLYVFVARTGHTIDSVELVSLDRDGKLLNNESGDTPGVAISFHGDATASQTLYYFSGDISDDGVKAHPGLMRFCASQGQGVSLLKATSYLMHEPGFARVRDFTLQHSRLIVQDDSGIPFRYFGGEWALHFYGRYVGPIDTFRQYPQSDLANAWSSAGSEPLGFSFGYQWQPSLSSLMVAVRQQVSLTN